MTGRTLNISLSNELLKALDRRARAEARSRSEVIRAATLAYLEWWDRWRALRGYGRQQAKALGIRPGDVNRLIREVRSKKRSSR